MFGRRNNTIISGSNVIMSGDKCTINGRTIKIPAGVKNVTVKNNKLYLDGKLYDGEDLADKEIVMIVIEGGVDTVTSDIDVTVNGDVTEVHAMRDVECSGDITSANAGRDIECDGSITNAKAGRDIN